MEFLADSVLNLLYEHRYIFSFLGGMFEGTYIMILAGVLYKFGYFKFLGVTLALFMGYFFNGIAFYLIGYFGGRRVLKKYLSRLHLTNKLLIRFEEYFKKHSIKAVFLSRISYGLGIPGMIIAGGFKMKWKKLLIANLTSSAVWVLGTFGLGYVFGISYEALGVITKTVSVGLVIALFIVIISFSILIVYWLRKFAKTKFIRKLESHPSQFLRGISLVINKAFNNKKKDN